MNDTKTKVLQIRLTELEKDIIKEKAEILELTVTDYIKKCCIFNNVSEMFKEKFHRSED